MQLMCPEAVPLPSEPIYLMKVEEEGEFRLPGEWEDFWGKPPPSIDKGVGQMSPCPRVFDQTTPSVSYHNWRVTLRDSAEGIRSRREVRVLFRTR